MGGRRRAALVAAGVLSLSSALGGYFAMPAFAEANNKVAGTPCTTAARACVDIDKQTAWLIKNGQVIRGPVDIASGGEGQETPMGTFKVYNKVKDYKSKESRMANGQPAPMPWSVFFAPGGIALHAGSPSNASAGCVHLPAADAQAFFNDLQIGDRVEVGQTLNDPQGGFYGVNAADSTDHDGDDSSGDDSSGDDSSGDDSSGDDSSGDDSSGDGDDGDDSDDGGGDGDDGS